LENSNTYDDNLLFEQIAEGDEDAFAKLFYAYGPRLHAYFTTLTKSPTNAEELVQNTFIRVWINRDKLPGIQNVKAWIFRVGANEGYNFLRRKAVETRVFGQLQYSAEESTRGDESLYNELKHAIAEAIDALPDRRRQVYLLSREEGLKHHEIADRLGITLSTVKKTLGDAREDIRAFLTRRGLLMLAILFSSAFY